MPSLADLLLLIKSLGLYKKYSQSTMMPRRAYVANLALVGQVLRDPALQDGAIVECGTWRGGMSAGLIEIGGSNRRYLFFDSFEGLPPAKRIDGPAAINWQADTTSDRNFNNCASTIEEFRLTVSRTQCPESQIEVHKGLFSETMRRLDSPAIAVLRLDGDWYESTMTCLAALWDKVLPHGLVILDDYYVWDGCSRAVHDFLSVHKAPERVFQSRWDRSLAFIVKGPSQSAACGDADG